MIALTDADTILSTNKSLAGLKGWRQMEAITAEEGREVFNFNILKCGNFTADGREIKGQYHLERDTDREIIPSASLGEQFNPVQHHTVYDYIVNDIMPHVEGMKLEMVGTLHHAATGIVCATLGEAFSIKGDNSPQMTRIIYANPCNGTGRLTLGFTTVRIVCQNTLQAAINQANDDGWKIKHTKNAEVRCEGALKQLKACANAALEMRARAEALADIGANSKMLASALDAVYPTFGIPTDSPAYTHLIAKREEVVRQFESGETAQTMSGNKTAWTLFNAFTFPIFNSTKLSNKTDQMQVQYAGMVGKTAKEVRDIFATVEEVVA